MQRHWVRARQLRNSGTDAERRLWYFLRQRNLAGYKFRRQYPIAGYIVDLVCVSARVVVELDGGQHAEAVSDEGWLFGEDGARALISCPPAHVAGLQRSAHAHGLACHYLGLVYDEDPRLIIQRGERSWEWSVDRLRKTYMDAIPRRMAVIAPATGGA